VEPNPEKRNPRDFALWKFSDKPGERHMEWKSPWGLGFPGWHLECSAMSMKYLGETFDIHAGGEDLKSTHHPNEIAQSEGATGKRFVNYWIHSNFIKVDGKRMGKSLGNAYTISDIEDKGFDPLALRYLYLTAHYKDTLNFTWDSLSASQNGLNNLRNQVNALKNQEQRTVLSEEKQQKVEGYRNQFLNAINNDLNMPEALAVVWSVLKSNIPSNDKYDLIMSFDEVLGLNLSSPQVITTLEVPEEVQKLISKREQLRKEGKFEEGDKVRDEIEKLGYTVKDTPTGSVVSAQNVTKTS
jgi:cysteinyl-tRNA synthetase